MDDDWDLEDMLLLGFPGDTRPAGRISRRRRGITTLARTPTPRSTR